MAPPIAENNGPMLNVQRHLIALPKFVYQCINLTLSDLWAIDEVTGQVKLKIIDIWNMFTLWWLAAASQLRIDLAFAKLLSSIC